MKKIWRNAVVELLGTPDRVEGSLNDPREREEGGVRFNEKWIYKHLKQDPAGVPMRVIYWRRYDFTGTMVRNNANEPWRPDSRLEEALASAPSRVDTSALREHPPLKPAVDYHPASEFKGAPDLGGT
jgi:hypothetical protein